MTISFGRELAASLKILEALAGEPLALSVTRAGYAVVDARGNNWNCLTARHDFTLLGKMQDWIRILTPAPRPSTFRQKASAWLAARLS